MRKFLIVLWVLTGVFILAGCGGSAASVTPPAGKTSGRDDSLLPPSIGTLCELVGYESVRVEGYGLVWSLPGTGSGDCPRYQKEFLVKYLQKHKDRGYLSPAYDEMTAEQIIDSPTTAAVRVSGVVPAGSPKGSRFEVELSIPWATQTTSLQGGILFPTELQVIVQEPSGRILTRQAAAMASGPVFINPFPLSRGGEAEAVRADPRKGVVLSGGRSFRDRRIQLALLEPNSSVAQQIQDRINARFQKDRDQRVADANRYVVTITIPERYRDDYEHFVKVMMGLYLQQTALSQELVLQELDRQVRAGGTNYEEIALAWEGIGKGSLRYLESIYQNEKEPAELAFYAGRTALSLDDRKAIDPLIRLSLDDSAGAIQLRSIGALGQARDDVRARAALESLLDHTSLAVRIAAYESLRDGVSGRIERISLLGNFDLEIIDASGEPVVTVWAGGQPRIAIFGKGLACKPNVYLESYDRSITINAGAEDEQVKILRRPSVQEDFVTVRSGFGLKSLVPAMAGSRGQGGAEMTFSQVIDMLQQLIEKRAIPAQFKIFRGRSSFSGENS